VNAPTARLYRFGDATRPGLLLGLGARQAVPVVAGILWLAAVLQTPPTGDRGGGPLVGTTVARSAAGGHPLAETLIPAVRPRSCAARPTSWAPALLGTPVVSRSQGARRLEAIEVPVPWIAGRSTGMSVIRDRSTGSVTGVLRVRGRVPAGVQRRAGVDPRRVGVR
jgi:hypothetical protein